MKINTVLLIPLTKLKKIAINAVNKYNTLMKVNLINELKKTVNGTKS